MKGRSGRRPQRKGKQPKPYWKWNPPDRRWYHPASLAKTGLSIAVYGLAGGEILDLLLTKVMFNLPNMLRSVETKLHELMELFE